MLGLPLLATQGSYYAPANGVRLTKGLELRAGLVVCPEFLNKRIASVRLELIDSL